MCVPVRVCVCVPRSSGTSNSMASILSAKFCVANDAEDGNWSCIIDNSVKKCSPWEVGIQKRSPSIECWSGSGGSSSGCCCQ